MVPTEALVRLAVFSLLACSSPAAGRKAAGGWSDARSRRRVRSGTTSEPSAPGPQEDDETDRLACEDGHYAVVFKDVEKSIAHFIPRRTKTGYTAVAVQAETTLLQTPQGDHFAFQGIGCWASARGEPTYSATSSL